MRICTLVLLTLVPAALAGRLHRRDETRTRPLTPADTDNMSLDELTSIMSQFYSPEGMKKGYMKTLEAQETQGLDIGSLFNGNVQDIVTDSINKITGGFGLENDDNLLGDFDFGKLFDGFGTDKQLHNKLFGPSGWGVQDERFVESCDDEKDPFHNYHRFLKHMSRHS